MKIAGIKKFSLLDYPKKISFLIFTQGCPFRCSFCHNSSLVIPSLYTPLIPEKEIFDFLNKRKNQLDAVVITGGEPTIQKDLKKFILKIKKLNYLVKLDTSGINPDILKDLIEENILDYIAMDIKAPLKKYEKIIKKRIDSNKIKKSIKLIINSSLLYEFRTTIIKNIISQDDILSIAKTIKGAKRYILQKFISETPLDKTFKNKKNLSEKTLLKLKEKIEKNYVNNCSIR